MSDMNWICCPLVAQNATARAFIEQLIKERKSPSTIENYSRDLNDFLSAFPDVPFPDLLEADETQIAHYVDWLWACDAQRGSGHKADRGNITYITGSKLAPTTIRRRISALRSFYRWAIRLRHRHDSINPVREGMRKMGMAPSDIGCLLGHTDPLKSLPWYLREDKHHLGRAYRKANPLERYVAAILDTNAQAKQEPCVFYYLADGPEGGPRMCGNPHFSRCIHQMKCIESEAFIDHELAETIEKREGAVLISVPVPLPSQMVAELNEQDEAGSDTIAKLAALPPPLLPGPAFHFNKKVPLRSVAASIEDLRTRLAQVEAQIAKKKGKTDRRNASLQALLREQDELKTLIEAQQTHDSTTDLRESV